MIDIILIFGYIIGALILIINKKKFKSKQLKIVGFVIIIVSAAFSIPDFITGFIEGYNEALKKI